MQSPKRSIAHLATAEQCLEDAKGELWSAMQRSGFPSGQKAAQLRDFNNLIAKARLQVIWAGEEIRNANAMGTESDRDTAR